MRITTTFNEKTLDSYIPGFRTLSVSGREVNDVEIKSSDNVTDGSTFTSRRVPEKEITVSFMLKKLNSYAQYIPTISVSSFADAQKFLLGQLNFSEPKKLVFSDEPDKYFTAMFSGAKLSEKHDKVWSGELTFICFDPLRYALQTKSFNAIKDDDGVLSLVIKNTGNAEVPITYEATMASDNGYIGLMQRDTGEIMQFGYLEEADGETYTESEVLLDTAAMFAATNDASGTACVSDPTFTVNGSLGEFTPSESTRKWLGLKTDVSATGWHGGQRTIEIPADSEGVSGAANFFCYFRRWFQKGKVKQLGFQSIFFLDADKNPICGTRLGAYNAGDWNATLDFVIGGQKVKTIKGTANDQSSSMWRESNGHDALTKEGSKFTFHYAGKYYSFVNDSYADTAIRYVQINISNYSTYEQMTRNYLGVLTFTKNNVSKWQDNPNRYATGDVVRIDGSEGKVYVNDLVRMGDEIMGTEYFKAQPGLTVVRVYQSSWASDLDITATIREAWL